MPGEQNFGVFRSFSVVFLEFFPSSSAFFLSLFPSFLIFSEFSGVLRSSSGVLLEFFWSLSEFFSSFSEFSLVSRVTREICRSLECEPSPLGQE